MPTNISLIVAYGGAIKKSSPKREDHPRNGKRKRTAPLARMIGHCQRFASRSDAPGTTFTTRASDVTIRR